jgi:hypothetical protein
VKRNGRDFAWEIAHEAVSRLPPISHDTIVAHTHMYTHDATGDILGFVHRSRSIFCHPVPNPSGTIRNSFIAAC